MKSFCRLERFFMRLEGFSVKKDASGLFAPDSACSHRGEQARLQARQKKQGRLGPYQLQLRFPQLEPWPCTASTCMQWLLQRQSQENHRYGNEEAESDQRLIATYLRGFCGCCLLMDVGSSASASSVSAARFLPMFPVWYQMPSSAKAQVEDASMAFSFPWHAMQVWCALKRKKSTQRENALMKVKTAA